MNLKRGVGINHYYKKIRKQVGKDTLTSTAIIIKETRWKTCTCQHWYMANLSIANGKLPS